MRRNFLLISFTIAISILAGCAITGNSNGGSKMTIRDFAERDQRAVETVIYKKAGGQDLKMLVCKPDGWKKGQKRPAMVWIHGGAWVFGEPEGFLPHMKYSAARGAVSFGLQYRLMKSPDYRDDKKKSVEENQKLREDRLRGFINGPSIKDCIADCEDAIRYIRKHADELGVDSSKISVIGDSAGAHLAACLGTLAPDDARANAVIACSSISDMTNGIGLGFIKPGKDSDFSKPQEDPDRIKRAKEASPLYNISKNGTAFLILQGLSDWLGDQPEKFYNEIKKTGVDCELKTYPGARHAFVVYGYSATLEEITRALLDLDEFLLKRGLLDGPTSIKMPDYQPEVKLVAEIKEPFTGRKSIKQDTDFPGLLTIAMKVKPPAKFKGKLFEMPGTFGCCYSVDNNGNDFSAKKMRQRGAQIKLQPETWQDVQISMGKDKVVIKAGDQTTEIPNEFRHGFVSNEIIVNDGLNAEIKEFKIFGSALGNNEVSGR